LTRANLDLAEKRPALDERAAFLMNLGARRKRK
jgi:hypothetical protein